MARTVTALVTHAGSIAGTVGPFPVEIPWWAEVVPVAARLKATLGVPVIVLRLLAVNGRDGGRDGHVTYHAEALDPPEGVMDGAPPDLAAAALGGHPLRMPWSSRSGVLELLSWAADRVDLTGPPEQRKSWNLSGLFRLRTAGGPVWLKATPPFAAGEAAAIGAFARVDPGLVPTVLAAAPGRLLLADIAGEDCWDASHDTVADVIRRLSTAQACIDRPPGGLADRRPEAVAAAVTDLLAGPLDSDLTREETLSVLSLQWRWEKLAECGLPDTVVHGDFHPGNWRRGSGPVVTLDFADAHWGNPVLDGLRVIEYLPAAARPAAARAWAGAWQAAFPRSRPDEALRIAGPLGHLAYAVRYQEFLDNIEPSEHPYHRGDPVTSVRRAIATADRDGGPGR